VARKNDFMTELENKANGLLQREVDGKLLSSNFIPKGPCRPMTLFAAITNWLAGLLSKQKRNDFRPKEEEVILTLTTQVWHRM
jgi:hypothetical protein